MKQPYRHNPWQNIEASRYIYQDTSYLVPISNNAALLREDISNCQHKTHQVLQILIEDIWKQLTAQIVPLYPGIHSHLNSP